MIVIVDYGAGNILSVSCALKRLGEEYILSDDPAVIAGAERLILPGVGNAAAALGSLRSKGLDGVIRSLRKPVLGICVGMQILCNYCEEGDSAGLGVFDCEVRRFPSDPDAKVPHMGWNRISNLEGKLFRGVENGSYVYFVHSYAPTTGPDTVATCRHGEVLFSAALRYENFFGTQFHPEKSGATGEMILKNFLSL